LFNYGKCSIKTRFGQLSTALHYIVWWITEKQ
jgi:hypothetical protein